MGAYKIELEHVTKEFRIKRQTITAVQDASFAVKAQEFVSLVGPSGCGKSTIIRMIDGIIHPTSGSVLVDGEDYTGKLNREQLRKIGFVFQSHNLLPWKTVWENLTLPLRVMGLSGPKWDDLAAGLLKMVQLDGHRDTYVESLSNSMQQRLGVIRALVYDPEIVLFDEPFGSLDETMRELLDMEILDIWQRTGKTVLFITHSVQEAVLLSQRVFVMATNPGRIIRELTIDLPFPRTLEMTGSPEFLAYEEEITGLIGDVRLDVIK